jgi:hypothetical protein
MIMILPHTLSGGSWVKYKKELEAQAHLIDKSVKLHTKDNWFCKMLAVILMIVTFGGMSYRVFLDRFATTIGPLQFYPASWTVAQVKRIIIHESRHTRQARWFGLWIHPWLGMPLFAAFYLLTFFPVGLAFFRAYFEMDAMRYELNEGLKTGVYSKEDVLYRATNFGNTVCSGKYGWALPKSWGVPMFERAAESIVQDVS